MAQDLIKQVSIHPQLAHLIYQIIQTQDIFHIRFQPECSECDISIYEYKNYFHIREEVLEKLKNYKLPHTLKHLILLNLDNQSKKIQSNIEYFGVPHIFD